MRATHSLAVIFEKKKTLLYTVFLILIADIFNELRTSSFKLAFKQDTSNGSLLALYCQHIFCKAVYGQKWTVSLLLPFFFIDQDDANKEKKYNDSTQLYLKSLSGVFLLPMLSYNCWISENTNLFELVLTKWKNFSMNLFPCQQSRLKTV